MIRLIIDNLPGVQERLKRRGPAVVEALRTEMNRQLVRLQAHIQTEHLSAPAGYSEKLLHQRSGKLKQSIRVSPAENAEGSLRGQVLGAGGPAWYGRVHEFGGSWIVSAREGVRQRFSASGHLRGATTFGVREYRVNMPERSFMRASLAELRDTIVSEMRRAMSEALE